MRVAAAGRRGVEDRVREHALGQVVEALEAAARARW